MPYAGLSCSADDKKVSFNTVRGMLLPAASCDMSAGSRRIKSTVVLTISEMYSIFFCLAFIALLAVAVTAEDNRMIVVITGCSTGIGKATALAFANAGNRFKVYATMRNPNKWDGPVDNPYLIPTSMDVTSDESVTACISKVSKENDGRPVDIVINNAGYGIAGYLESVNINEAKDVFDVNVWGIVRVLQAVLPGMRKKGGGYVINISSTSGIRGIPAFEFYTGSKFALEGITDSLRYSLLPFNISITNVNAGPVRTAFTDRFGKSEVGGKGTRVVEDDEQNYLQDLTNRMIASLDRRMAAPEAQTSEDVAQVILNLAKMHLEDGEHKRLVPFNVGTSEDSQRIVEEVRKHPTGWGGIFDQMKAAIPPLKRSSSIPNRGEL